MSLVAMTEFVVPEANTEDDDDVVVALETARVSVERGDTEAAVKWLHRAASAARRQGRPNRAGSLSRSAAKLGANGDFEAKEGEPQVLADVTEDDFVENTIVETAAEIAAKSAGSVEPQEVPQVAVASPVVPPLEKPTPVAPLAAQPKAAAHPAVRVAVKKLLGGKYEARPLTANESPAVGESEALLVPVEGGKSIS
jgi:hypothetical protein